MQAILTAARLNKGGIFRNTRMIMFGENNKIYYHRKDKLYEETPRDNLTVKLYTIIYRVSENRSRDLGG